MSVISFSGLSTGLDTSSWVSALTALKNAKIESLEEEKSAIVSLKDTVSGIKSFFTSFRNSLNKLTDAKYGIDALSIFKQNLANSSNASKITATATPSASRDTYEVNVSQVASATKANTGVRKTVTVTCTADMNTKLSVLGVEEGYVSLNNKEFRIENSDTIGTLLDKINDLGITATYDEDNARFTIAGDIYESDQGSTNLFDKLGLQFANVEGAKSNQLMTSGLVQIDANTKLSDIGINGGNIEINENVQNINLGSNATVQTLLNWFNTRYGTGTATINSDGIITITGLDMNEVSGGSNLMTALGMTETVDSVSAISNALSYSDTNAATWSTKLGEINTTYSDYKLVMQVGGGGANPHRYCNSDLYAA